MSRPKALKYCATCKYYGICKKRRHILREKKNSKKTGRHIDIEGMLKQIGGKNDNKPR